jgi:hypothetical protein
MYSRVYVEITNICNMACSFCHGHHRAPRQMTQEEYARVLQQLRGKTEYIYHHLMGEPLTHPLLPRFIEMAKAAGFRPMITTNGTLLPVKGDGLLGKGLHKVNISLHSFEADQPDAHRRYVENIGAFAEKAWADGIIVSMRLWNNGCDQGKNPIILDILRQVLPGQWQEIPVATAFGTSCFWSGATGLTGRIWGPGIMAGRFTAMGLGIISASSAMER